VKGRKPEPPKQGRIARRKQQAGRAALKAAGPSATAVAVAAAVQEAHAALYLPPVPYAWMTAGGIVALRGRDGIDALRERRAGGKRAMRQRRKFQGTASRREVGRSLSPRAAARRTAGIHAAPVVIGTSRGRAVAGSAEDTYLLAAPPRSGKALALDTPVPTPAGWTTMGELRDGDVIFGFDGQPVKVLRAWEVRYDRPCYEVGDRGRWRAPVVREHQGIPHVRVGPAEVPA
jgi:hypothetical protein